MEFSKYNVAVQSDNKSTAQVRLMTPGCQLIQQPRTNQVRDFMIT